MKTIQYSHTGAKLEDFNLPKDIFEAKINTPLLAQAIRVYQSNLRQSPAKAKTRGEVDRTTKKIYKQKGTGNARHGSKGAPIFVGGGKAHGPSGEQNYHLKLTQKMKLKALVSSLSSKAKDKSIQVIADLDKMNAKTKAADKLVTAIKTHKSLTLVIDAPNKDLIKAMNNLKNVSVTQASRLNAYEVLKSPQLVITKEAIEVLKSRLK